MKKWLQHKYYKLAEKNSWLPPASHCSKRNCRDNDCPVNKEMMKYIRLHYTGEWK